MWLVGGMILARKGYSQASALTSTAFIAEQSGGGLSGLRRLARVGTPVNFFA